MSSTLLVLLDTRLSSRVVCIKFCISFPGATTTRPYRQFLSSISAPIILPLLRSILFPLIDFKGLGRSSRLTSFAFRFFSRILDKSSLSLDPSTTFPLPVSSPPTRNRARFVEATLVRFLTRVRSRGHLNRTKRLSLSVSRIMN